MSSQTIKRDFHCMNDCRMEGCPGHVATLQYHHTSDTVLLYIDDKLRTVFDHSEWRVFVNLDDALRNGVDE